MLIGISGKIGSGKDTFADLLSLAIYCSKPFHKMPVLYTDDLNDIVLRRMVKQATRIEIIKFADALKDIVCRLTGCTREQLEDQDFKNSFMPNQWWELKEIRGRRMYPKYRGVFEDGDEMWKPTYRQFLQELGTNVLRNWIPNIHVNATFAARKSEPVPVKDTRFVNWGGKVGELKAETEVWPKWIITDMRFPNEVAGVKERGGIVIRINRYPKTLIQSRVAGGAIKEIPFDPANKQHMNLWKGECMRGHESETALDNYQDWDAVIDNNGTIEDLYQQAIKIVKQFKLT